MLSKKVCVIDRFEGDWAVIEYDRTNFNVPKSLLDEKVIEGDVVNIQITPNKEETTKRRQQIEELRKKLFKNN